MGAYETYLNELGSHGDRMADLIAEQRRQNIVDEGGNILNPAMTGAAIGSLFPGWGTAIGAGIGGIAGLLKGISARKEAGQGTGSAILGGLTGGLMPNDRTLGTAIGLAPMAYMGLKSRGMLDGVAQAAGAAGAAGTAAPATGFDALGTEAFNLAKPGALGQAATPGALNPGSLNLDTAGLLGGANYPDSASTSLGLLSNLQGKDPMAGTTKGLAVNAALQMAQDEDLLNRSEVQKQAVHLGALDDYMDSTNRSSLYKAAGHPNLNFGPYDPETDTHELRFNQGLTAEEMRQTLEEAISGFGRGQIGEASPTVWNKEYWEYPYQRQIPEYLGGLRK